MKIGEQVEVLGDRQVLIQSEALRHVADGGMGCRGIRRHVVAEHDDTASGRTQQSGDQPQQRGLAGTIRPDQAGNHARLDLGRDAIQCDVRRRAGKHVAQVFDDCDSHFVTGSVIVIGMP